MSSAEEAEGAQNRMPVQRSSSDRLKGFFFTLVRKSFDQLGVGDQQIAEYVASGGGGLNDLVMEAVRRLR